MKSLQVVFLASLGLVVLPSCAGMMKQHRETVCQGSYAYESGLNDGRVEKPASSSRFVQTCGPVQGEPLANRYMQGYKDGLNQSYRDKELEARQSDDGGSGVSLDMGGSRLRVDYPPFGRQRKTAMRNKKKYFCEVKVFTRRYSAYGQTQVEARERLLERCSAEEKSDFFCKKADCQRNI